MSTELPDVQCSKPEIKIPIKQVGVENIYVPFMLQLRRGAFYQLQARVSMRTNLERDLKGISMSRLILTLRPYLDLPLNHKIIEQILEEINKNISSDSSFLKFEFNLPIERKSPISNNKFPIYYKCRFEGQLQGGSFRFFQGVVIQYASYCPCSAALCNDLENKNLKGFPHNQRSFADILVECDTNAYIWLEDIIENVEVDLKTLPYPIIKRVDEQEIARIASNNPMFVEDAVRIISEKLDQMDDVIDWIVKCIHEESIHTSEAIAINWKGVTGGFDGSRYL